MEFWEGAILVVGGVILVGYMSKQKSLAANGAAAQAGVNAIGTSNQSNLTNTTNQAGGYPTIAGEPLEPPQPPVGAPSIPVTITPHPIVTPIRSSPTFGNVPRICPAWGCGPTPIFRPVGGFQLPKGTTTTTAAPVKGTALTPRTPAPSAPQPIVRAPISGGAITKTQATSTPTTPPRVTFTQSTGYKGATERPMDQHLMML